MAKKKISVEEQLSSFENHLSTDASFMERVVLDRLLKVDPAIYENERTAEEKRKDAIKAVTAAIGALRVLHDDITLYRQLKRAGER